MLEAVDRRQVRREVLEREAEADKIIHAALSKLQQEVRRAVADQGELTPRNMQAVRQATTILTQKVFAQLRKDLRALQRDAFIKGAEDVDSRIGGDRMAHVPNMVVEAVDTSGSSASVLGTPSQLLFDTAHAHLADQIKGEEEAVIKSISMTVSRGALGDIPLKQVLDEIGNDVTTSLTFKSVQHRAEAISRTEIHRIYSLAGHQRMLDAKKYVPSLGKEWISTVDKRTRPAHLAANGQKVLADEKYQVGGEELSYPGDPAASGSNTIQCRCVSVPVVLDEPEPKPVQPWSAPIDTTPEPLAKPEKPKYVRPSRSKAAKAARAGAPPPVPAGARAEFKPFNPWADDAAGKAWEKAKKAGAASWRKELEHLGNPWKGGRLDSTNVRSWAKANIQARLETRLAARFGSRWDDYHGLLYGAKAGVGNPRSWIQAWAGSSSDENTMSMLMQEAASKKFNLDVSPMMRVKIDAVKRAGMLAGASPARVKAMEEMAEAMVDEMYEMTQEFFRRQGIKTLKLTRGMRWGTYGKDIGSMPPEVRAHLMSMAESYGQEWKDYLATHANVGSPERVAEMFFARHPDPGKVADVLMNPLSSYSSSMSVANHFGTWKFVIEVPVEDVLATSVSGLGCLNELEYVVVGGVRKVFMKYSPTVPAGW